MTEKYNRFISVLDDEMVYITDKKGLKTLDDFIEEVKKEYLEDYNESEVKERHDEIIEVATDRYDDYLYSNCMSGFEIEDTLNRLYDENRELKRDYDTLKRQDNARKMYQRDLEHKLDSLTGLWVTDKDVSDEDKEMYHMWRLK